MMKMVQWEDVNGVRVKFQGARNVEIHDSGAMLIEAESHITILAPGDWHNLVVMQEES